MLAVKGTIPNNIERRYVGWKKSTAKEVVRLSLLDTVRSDYKKGYLECQTRPQAKGSRITLPDHTAHI